MVKYEGKGFEILTKKNILIGDAVEIKTDVKTYNGILMPRYESSDRNHIVLKLRNGYNIGINLTKIKAIDRIDPLTLDQVVYLRSEQEKLHLDKVIQTSHSGNEGNVQYNGLPRIALISTGGTIASKVDYRTGGVTPALSASDLYSAVPELAKYASIDSEVLLNEYSENLGPQHWTLIASKIAEKIRLGIYQGIILAHGTDTMHYTASALSFALQKLPIPVILVGAQRSSDRPSSDAAPNLIGAVVFATKSEYSGVFLSMHAGSSDNVIACHIGTRVRKNHTSRRDAFESIDIMPIALVKGEDIEMQLQHDRLKVRRRRHATDFVYRPAFDKRAILLKYHPGFNPQLVNYAIQSGYKAIVLEGTGLGHVNRDCFPELQKAIRAGIMVFMTSQCIWGRVKMTVYGTGRDLLDIGVIPLSNMLPETALVKAMWVIANIEHVEDAKEMMQENLVNEISPTSPVSLQDKN